MVIRLPSDLLVPSFDEYGVAVNVRRLQRDFVGAAAAAADRRRDRLAAAMARIGIPVDPSFLAGITDPEMLLNMNPTTTPILDVYVDDEEEEEEEEKEEKENGLDSGRGNSRELEETGAGMENSHRTR